MHEVFTREVFASAERLMARGVASHREGLLELHRPQVLSLRREFPPYD